MNYFYKLPTEFEDTNPIYYINLATIQSISVITELVPDTTGGTIKKACLVVNGIKYVYDSVKLADVVLTTGKLRAKEFEETNEEKELEFKRIQTRLEIIIQDIMKKAQLCQQKSNEVKIERLKSAFALDTEMLEKTEKREDDAKEIIERIKQYCEDKLIKFNAEETHLVLAAYHCVIDILKLINSNDDVIGRIRKMSS